MNDWWTATNELLDPEDQSLWTMTKRVVRIPIQSPLVNPGSIAVSDSEKAQVLADSLDAQFQPITVSSVPPVTEMVTVGLMSYFSTPASEPKLTNLDEVHEAIRGLKVARIQGPNGTPNRTLNLLPQ
jgi:hypothetical protein